MKNPSELLERPEVKARIWRIALQTMLLANRAANREEFDAWLFNAGVSAGYPGELPPEPGDPRNTLAVARLAELLRELRDSLSESATVAGYDAYDAVFMGAFMLADVQWRIRHPFDMLK